MTRGRARVEIAGAGLLAVGLASVCFFAPLFDDAYIHARCAEQLLRTGHAAFNAGSRLKTDSSTGYLLLLAASSWLVGNAVTALRVLQSLAVVLFVLRLRALGVALRGRLTVGHAALMVCALPAFLWSAYGGMETSLAVVCLASGVLSSLRARHGWALFYASLGACLRLELLPFVIYYAVWSSHFQARTPRALYACWPLLLCLSFDLLSYGTVLPQALIAKSIAYDLPRVDAVRLALSVSFERHVWWMAGLEAAWPALWLSARVHGEPANPLREGLILQLACLLGAWASSRSIVFPWYVATFSGLLTMVALLATREPAPRSVLGKAERVLSSVFSLALGCLAALALALDLGGSSAELASGVRAQRYLELGAGLYRHCPTCSLASSEIGGLGYGFRGRVHDALGLADAAALHFHPLRVPEERASYRVGAIPPAYVRLRDPDFVVSMPLFSEAFRRSTESRGFTRYDCPLVPEAPARSLWGDTLIQVFSRQPLPEPLLMSMRCDASLPEAGAAAVRGLAP
jgi:hypothetical protein